VRRVNTPAALILFRTDSFSSDSVQQRSLLSLNKINAAGVLTLRTVQDSEQDPRLAFSKCKPLSPSSSASP